MATTNIIPTIHNAEAGQPGSSLGTFRNEAFLDFTASDVKLGMREALRTVEAELGREYHLILGGERVTSKEKIVSTNPAHPAEKIGIHQEAELSHVSR